MFVQPIEVIDPEFAEVVTWLVHQDRVYVQGSEVYVRAIQVKTPERNSPCPCGSGLKYKKCCGLKPSPEV